MRTSLEQLVPEIVEALREISHWPWQRASDNSYGVSVLDAERELCTLVYPEEGHSDANIAFVTFSPLWFSSLVVGIVKEISDHNYSNGYHREAAIELALKRFNISQADYEWLKGKVEK